MKYKELVKALRHCSHDGLVKCNECKYGGTEWPVGCEEEMMRDAAAAIEELQAQLPKRGEWIHSVSVQGTTSGGITYHHGYTCSVCGGLMGRKGDAYCYKGGAKM